MSEPQDKSTDKSSADTPESSAAITVRSFNNFDVQAITDFWNIAQYPDYRSQPIEMDLFEQMVLAKAYFDPKGLFVAFQNDELVGFAHAGFGPNDRYNSVDFRCGCIPMVCYNDSPECSAILSALMDACEKYLLSHGVQQIQLGAVYPMAPFYLGLMKTSDLPGIFLKETKLIELAQQRGYHCGVRTAHYSRDTEGLDWAYTQQMRDMRLRYQVCMDFCPTPSNWWNAIAMNGISWSHFSLLDKELVGKRESASVAHCSLWMLDELTSRVPTTIGMSHFYVIPSMRGRHLALFMLTEILRGLMEQHIRRIQVQINADQFEAINLIEKRGFEKYNESAVYVKDC